MTSNQYREYEIIFLQELVKTINFSNNEYRIIFFNSCLLEFRERFSTRAKMLRDPEFLRRIYAKEYDKETAKIIGKTLKEKFSVINRQVEATLKEEAKNKGLELEEFSKGSKGKEIMSYLESDYFRIWLEENEDKIQENKDKNIPLLNFKLDGWRQLWSSAKYKNIVIQEIGKPHKDLDLKIEWMEDTTPRFSWKTKLFYKINSIQPGYLILIQKFASENIWCLAPSFLAEEYLEYRKLHKFPKRQNEPKLSSLEVDTGFVGLERVLAIITKNKPELDWFPENNLPPKKIDESHLESLICFLDQENKEDFEIFKAEYVVVAPS